MEEEKISILDHLEELRRRLLVCLLAVLLLFPLFCYFSQPCIDWLIGHFGNGIEMHAFKLPELFFLRMKVGFIAAVVGAFPIMAWQVWKFIEPGLYEHERHYALRFIFISSFLFICGALFALFAVFPMVLRFFVAMSSEHIKNTFGIANFVSMGTMMMLGFGIMFQLPILVFLLAVTEIVSLETMRKARPVVVVILLVVSAILTPPDVVSQLMMGLPAWLLFEISLIVSARSVRKRVAERKRREEEERLQEEEEERLEAEEAAKHPERRQQEEENSSPDYDDDDHYPDDDYEEYYDHHDYDYENDSFAATQEKAEKPSAWKLRGLRRRELYQTRRRRPPRTSRK